MARRRSRPTIRLTGLISTLVTDTVTARAIAALLD
jgi:hypothetical protein